MHARVAAAIERLYPQATRERAGEVANHLLKAGSFAYEQKLVRTLVLAGNTALGAAAFEEARSSFQIALSHQAVISAKEKADPGEPCHGGDRPLTMGGGSRELA